MDGYITKRYYERMRKLDKDTFGGLLKSSTNIKPRFKKDVRFTSSVADIDDSEWSERELIAIYDKSKNKGILLIQPYDALYMIAFEAGTSVRDTVSGRSKAVICDFCYTWRAGGNAGLVSFYADSHSINSTSQLCCFDLECSRHARTQTKDALVSRAQLREHISDSDRVVRLRKHLQSFVEKLQLTPVD